jgi:hypothetical protein
MNIAKGKYCGTAREFCSQMYCVGFSKGECLTEDGQVRPKHAAVGMILMLLKSKEVVNISKML